jgi:hypothetical protein
MMTVGRFVSPSTFAFGLFITFLGVFWTVLFMLRNLKFEILAGIETSNNKFTNLK